MKQYSLKNEYKEGILINLVLLIIVSLFVGIIMLVVALSFSQCMKEENVVTIDAVVEEIICEKDYSLKAEGRSETFVIAEQVLDSLEDKSALYGLSVGDAITMHVVYSEYYNYLLGVAKEDTVLLDKDFSFRYWQGNIHTTWVICVSSLSVFAVLLILWIVVKKCMKDRSVGIVDYLDGTQYGRDEKTKLMSYLSNIINLYLVTFMPLLGITFALTSVLGACSFLIFAGVLLMIGMPYLYFLIRNDAIITKMIEKYVNDYSVETENKEIENVFTSIYAAFSFSDAGLGIIHAAVSFSDAGLVIYEMPEDSSEEESESGMHTGTVIDYKELDLVCVARYRKIGELVSIYVMSRDFDPSENGTQSIKSDICLKVNSDLLYYLNQYNVPVENLQETISGLRENMNRNCRLRSR